MEDRSAQSWLYGAKCMSEDDESLENLRNGIAIAAFLTDVCVFECWYSYVLLKKAGTFCKSFLLKL